MNQPLISICIPCYEMNGKGKEFLSFSLSKIESQSYKNIEVVISDHSKGNDILDVCKSFPNIKINYHRNKNNIGSSSHNMNNSIELSNGEIIKILFQDDFLYNDDSIMNQYNSLISSECVWSVTSCIHLDFDNIIKDPYNPKFNMNILFENTLSSPSTIMFFRDNFLGFDNNLIWYMDTDFYKRTYDVYGLPNICNSINVVNRRHMDQVTRTIVDDDVVENEKKYLLKKYEGVNNNS